jgi:hypothetical protein
MKISRVAKMVARAFLERRSSLPAGWGEDEGPTCGACGRYEDEHSASEATACEKVLRDHRSRVEQSMADFKTKIGWKGLPGGPPPRRVSGDVETAAPVNMTFNIQYPEEMTRDAALRALKRKLGPASNVVPVDAPHAEGGIRYETITADVRPEILEALDRDAHWERRVGDVAIEALPAG